MNTNKIDKNDPKNLEGRKFRFVVSSAEDAAKIIKDRLGDNARVLSVKQVNGKGLTRFLSSPQLEIIVTVPQKEEVAVAEPVINETNRISQVLEEEIDNNFEDKATSSKKDLSLNSPYNKRLEDAGVHKPLDELLSSSGFDNGIIMGLKTSSKWEKMNDMSVAHGLAETMQWLKDEYNRVEPKEVAQRAAFFGVPGAGTTTALCKHLAKEVFINAKNAKVLKLENDNPNSDDALRVFCEVLGVSILKDNDDLNSVEDDDSLFIDVPGSISKDREDWGKLKGRLDSLRVETRVLVINAAYDADLIKDAFRLGESVGATHLVFSHLDELNSHAKLWPFVIKGGLPTLFFSCGQNITSDFSENVLDYLVQKTFPAIVAN